MVKEKRYDFLKFVNLKSLTNWNIKYITFDFTSEEKYNMVEIGKLLTRIKKKENINENKKYNRIKIKINAQGVEIRDCIQGKNIGTKEQYIVSEGQLVLSKIDARNGAFGLVPLYADKAIITSNFWTYDINTNLVNSDFLIFVLSSNNFKKNWEVCSNGSGNRLYLQEEMFLKTKIPLPPLEVQEKIVNQYNLKMNQAEKKEKEAKQIKKDIERYLFNELGISENIIEEKKGKYTYLKIVQFKDIKEWEVTKINNEIKYNTTKYEEIYIGDSLKILKEIFRGKSPKYNENSNAFIINQKCNRWNEIDLKYVKKVDKDWAESFDSKFYTKENDILINSTGEGTIGRATCIKEKEHTNLLYDNHILLLRLNNEYMDSQFFVYLFNSNYVQEQISILKGAISTKQTELGIEKVKKIKMPIPKLHKQKQISKAIKEKEETINNLINSVEQLRSTAKIKLQNEIFDKSSSKNVDENNKENKEQNLK